MIRIDVYEILKKKTLEASAVKKKIAELDADIGSGDYSTRKMEELSEQRYDLAVKLRNIVAAARQEARQYVEKYKAELEEQDSLRGEDLTDDARLFTAGVPLTRADLEAILARNSGNRTMEQLTIRFAEANNIELPVRYVGNRQAIEEADAFLSAVDLYCDHWIEDEKALDMLQKFFQVEDDEDGDENNE